MKYPAFPAAMAILLSVSAAPSAATAEVQLKYTGRPFSIFAVPDTWGQRFATVANSDDQPRVVKIGIMANAPSGALQMYSRVVTIPPHAQVQTTLAVRSGRFQPTGDSAARDKNKGRNVVEGEKGREDVVLYDEATGEQITRNFSLVQVLPERVRGLGYLSDGIEDHDSTSYLGKLPGRELGEVRQMHCRSSMMPDRWYGYSLADTLLLGSMEARHLRASQLKALLDWVRQGGTLVVLGGRHLQDLLQGQLGQVTGVCVTGFHETDRLTVTDRDGKSLEPVTLTWPLPLTELLVTDAEVLYEANGLPLLTHRTEGMGHVFVLATPAGAMEPPALHSVWATVSKESAGKAWPIDDGAFSAPARAALQKIAGQPGPGRLVPVTILAIVALFCLAAGTVFFLRRRGEMLWMILVPGVLLLSAGLYLYGRSQAQAQRLAFVGLISSLDSDSARVQGAFAYYSGAENRDIAFTAGSPRGVISKVMDANIAALSQEEVRYEDCPLLPPQPVAMKSTRAFEVDAVETVGRIGGELTYDAEGLSGTLTNTLGMDLADTILYADGRAYPVGTIPAGRDTPVRAAAARRLAPEEFTGSLMHSPTDTLRNELIRALVTKGRHAGKAPVLIGYALDIPLHPLRQTGVPRQGWSVVVCPARIVPPTAGAKALVPPGLVEVEYRSEGTPIWNPLQQKFVETYRPGELIVMARPPASFGAMEQASARIEVVAEAANYRMVVSGVTEMSEAAPPTDPRRRGRHLGQLRLRRTEVAEFLNPSGRIVAEIPDADRFRQPNGSYVFSIAVERARPGSEAGASPMESALRWSFESVDVSLEGIRR